MLRYLGLFALAASACMLLVGELGWLEGEPVDALVRVAVPAGVLCLLAGIAVAALSPVSRAMRGGRCARCGTAIERGQTYCHDHMQEAVNEYRDRARESSHYR
jgi:hypothetical protein